jgi:hypothetical protein
VCILLTMQTALLIGSDRRCGKVTQGLRQLEDPHVGMGSDAARSASGLRTIVGTAISAVAVAASVSIAAGFPMWAPDGVPITTEGEDWAGVVTVPDGANGAFVVWESDSTRNLSAQRVNNSGQPVGGATITPPAEEVRSRPAAACVRRAWARAASAPRSLCLGAPPRRASLRQSARRSRRRGLCRRVR